MSESTLNVPYIPDDIWLQIFDIATSVPSHIKQVSYLDNVNVPDPLKPPEPHFNIEHSQAPQGAYASGIRRHSVGIASFTDPQAIYRTNLLKALPTKRAIASVCKRWNALGLPCLYREIVVGGAVGKGYGRRAMMERGMEKLRIVRESPHFEAKKPAEVWDWKGVQSLEKTICGNADAFAPLVRALHIRVPPGPHRMPSPDERLAVATSLSRLVSATTRDPGRLDVLVLYSERLDLHGVNEDATEAILEALANATRDSSPKLRVLDTYQAFGPAEVSSRSVRALNEAVLRASNLKRLEYVTNWHESEDLVLNAGTLESVQILVRSDGAERQRVRIKLNDGEENRLSALSIELAGAVALSSCAVSHMMRSPIASLSARDAKHPSLTSLTLYFHSEFVPVSNVADALHFIGTSPWCSRLQTLVLRVRVLNRIYAGVANDDAHNLHARVAAPLASPIIRNVHTFAVYCDEGDNIKLRRAQLGVMVKALARCLEEYRKESGDRVNKRQMRLRRVRILNNLERDHNAVPEEMEWAHNVSISVMEGGVEWVEDAVRRFEAMGIRLENRRGEPLGALV